MHEPQRTRYPRLELAWALTLGVALGGCDEPQTQESSTPPQGALRRYTSGPEGFETHSYYYDTGEEVVVFDAQFTDELATELVETIHATTASPITHVVITHPNPDKFNGVQVLREAGARVVASAATAAAIPDVHAYKRAFWIGSGAFTDETYPDEAVVDETFTGALRLELASGARVDLVELASPGVSSTQTVAFLPDARAGDGALVVGDLVHHGTHAWLEGGIVDGVPRPDLASWRGALDELRSFPETTRVFGGRGEDAPLLEAVDTQQEYLRDVEAIVVDYIADVDDPRSLVGPDAATHHEALTTLIAAAYPDYAQPSLITYGIYGLLQALVSAGAS